jgi:hypothetical protein
MKQTDWRIILMVVLLHVILYAVFIGEAWVRESLAKENQMNRSMLGPEIAEHANARGDQWFTQHLVETEIIANSFRLFIPTEEQKAKSARIETLGAPIFTWFEGRIRVMWTLVYQSYLRISTALVWFPYVLFIFIPWVIDGLVQRRIKQTNFDYASPLRYAMSIRLVALLLIAFFLMVFAPFPMPTLITPLFFIASSFAIGILVANTLKRV